MKTFDDDQQEILATHPKVAKAYVKIFAKLSLAGKLAIMDRRDSLHQRNLASGRKVQPEKNRIRLDAEEREIMGAIERGEYVRVQGKELKAVAGAIAARRRDMTLTIRVNRQDIARIRKFAKSKGIPYQTFLSEVIHRVAETV